MPGRFLSGAAQLLLRLWLLLRNFHHGLYILTGLDIGHIRHVGDLAALGVGHDDTGVVE